jgi:predicted PhzF superfamily epimerase YddE/YHI9
MRRRSLCWTCSRPSDMPATRRAARHMGLPDGTREFRIEHGSEIGGPSPIELCMVTAGRKLSAAWIGGHAVVASAGTIEASPGTC